MVKLQLRGLAEEVKDGDTLEFIDSGEERIIKNNDGSDKRILTIGIKMPNGDERDWNINWTSQKVVADKLGNDTEKWMGHKVKITKTQQMVNKKLMDVVFVKEVM